MEASFEPRESMTETTVRSILRIVAVVTILVGVTIATSTLITLIGAGAMRDVTDPRTGLRFQLAQDIAVASLLSPIAIAVEDLLLWGISSRLARRIVR